MTEEEVYLTRRINEISKRLDAIEKVNPCRQKYLFQFTEDQMEYIKRNVSLELWDRIGSMWYRIVK